jgi:CheY-like chemotaxis protein
MSPATESSPAPELGPLHALVADEAPEIRESLAAAIGSFDPLAEVVQAETGHAALEALSTGRIELAFINVQLPGLTGAEALAFARAQRVRPLSVLMSRTIVPRWAEVATELGAYEFLKKPLDTEHVLQLLRGHGRMRTPARVLLACASPTARQLTHRLLAGTSFTLEIDETDNGQHALKLMRLSPYDLAFIDVALNGIDGLEACCQARDIAPNAKLILMAGGDQTLLAQAVRHFGVHAVLTKPFFPRDVNPVLHGAFGLRRPYLLNAVTADRRQGARREEGVGGELTACGGTSCGADRPRHHMWMARFSAASAASFTASVRVGWAWQVGRCPRRRRRTPSPPRIP